MLYTLLLLSLCHVTESHAVLAEDAGELKLAITIDAAAGIDLMMQTGRIDAVDDSALEIPAPEIHDAILEYLAGRFKVSLDGQTVDWRPRDLIATTGDHTILGQEDVPQWLATFSASRPRGDHLLEVVHELFAETEAGHVHTLRIELSGRSLLNLLPQGEKLEFAYLDSSAAGTMLRWRSELLRAARWHLSHPWALLFACALVTAANGVRSSLVQICLFLFSAAGACAVARAGIIHPSFKMTTLTGGFAALYLSLENLLARDFRYRAVTVALFGLVFGLHLSANAPHLDPPQPPSLAFVAGYLLCTAACATICMLFVGSRWWTLASSQTRIRRSALVLCLLSAAAWSLEWFR